MRTLPYDYTRCKPIKPDGFCKNCKRWWDHPEQKNNPFGQSAVTVNDSRDEACMYVPVSLEKK